MAFLEIADHGSYRNLIQFVPSSVNQGIGEKANKSLRSCATATATLGREAKEFYESLLTESQTQSVSSSLSATSAPSVSSCSSCLRRNDRPTSKRKKSDGRQRLKNSEKLITTRDGPTVSSKSFFSSQLLCSDQRQHFKLLHKAELGLTQEVADLLKSGLDVNFQDFYGWTALMSAAKEGNVDVVKLLLQSGASKDLRNSTGDTALTIAKNARQLSIVDLIINHDSFQSKESGNDEDSNEMEVKRLFKCEVCNDEFSLKDQKSHLTSTLHLFNVNQAKGKIGPSFLLPESNRGYQMLLRSGWMRDGLGPDGKGVKYPVKTVLKRDRKGLGSESETARKKARVTHFSAEDTKAIESSAVGKRRELNVRTVAKNELKFKEKRARRKEMHLRYEFS